MKTLKMKTALLTGLAAFVFATGAMAQTTQTTTTNKTPTKTSASTTAGTKSSTTQSQNTASTSPKTTGSKTQAAQENKQKWIDRYNKLKPRLDEIASNAKLKDAHPDFVKEAGTLRQMAEQFKSKIDNYDTVPQAQKQQYIADLEKQHTDIKNQYEKVKDLWDQYKDEKNTNTAPKTDKTPASK